MEDIIFLNPMVIQLINTENASWYNRKLFKFKTPKINLKPFQSEAKKMSTFLVVEFRVCDGAYLES